MLEGTIAAYEPFIPAAIFLVALVTRFWRLTVPWGVVRAPQALLPLCHLLLFSLLLPQHFFCSRRQPAPLPLTPATPTPARAGV